MQKYAEAESNANAFALTCSGHPGMFRPEEPGGLGLTDMTGGTGGASRQAYMAEA